MKLSRAILCLDCEEVFEGGDCPKCGGKYQILLYRWAITSPREKESRHLVTDLNPAQEDV